MTSADNTSTAVRRRTVLAAVIAMAGLAIVARAWADPVDLKVVDRETGQALRTWRHDGRLFVAGEPGARYGLRVTNHTDGRVLVVMSVDGVNILTGQTASYDQNGYVFDAHESYDVNGWRKSDSEVAAFTFAPLPESYAARTGRPGDVGVIGMAVFRERPPAQARLEAPRPMTPPTWPAWRGGLSGGYPNARDDYAARAPAPVPPTTVLPTPFAAAAPPAMGRSAAPPASSAAIASPPAFGALAERRDEKLGTAHGAREWSMMTTVAFERAAPYPQFVRQIEYNTWDNLAASGVIPPSPYAERRPRPFPRNADGAGYVPDPPCEP